MNTDKNSEFWKSKEAESAATVYGGTLVSSVAQTYATAALIQLTGSKYSKLEREGERLTEVSGDV